MARLTGRAVDSRLVLHAAPGRCVERVVAGGQRFALKWRDDREDDREAVLYAGVAPALLRALNAPRRLGATRAGATHLLLLQWVDGRAADYARLEDVQRAFAHLGRAAALSAQLLRGPREAFADEAAWRLLLPDPVDLSAGAADPPVLDPGDLHAGNVLLTARGGVCVLDFENMAVRPRSRALDAVGRDPSLPAGVLAEAALRAYRRGGGWSSDPLAPAD